MSKEEEKVDELGEKLNPKQRDFCFKYATYGTEFYGNATQSYKKAYAIELDHSAARSASKLLKDTGVLDCINAIFDLNAVSNKMLDDRVLKVALYGKDEHVISAYNAINKVRGRIVDKIADVSEQTRAEMEEELKKLEDGE